MGFLVRILALVRVICAGTPVVKLVMTMLWMWGAAATVRRRTVPTLPCSRPPGRVRGGMRGVMSGVVMAAYPRGTAGAAQQSAGLRVRVMSGLGEISPVWVSEDRLHQIANALWVLSSFLTMRGSSAVTRLAQGLHGEHWRKRNTRIRRMRPNEWLAS